MSHKQHYVCSCYYTNNFFIRRLGHVVFVDRAQFIKDYTKVLKEKGISSEKDVETISSELLPFEHRECLICSNGYNARLSICDVQTLTLELQRRKNQSREYLERHAEIQRCYTPVHKHVYHLQESFLAAQFLEMVQYSQTEGATVDGLMSFVVWNKAEKVYAFPVFAEEFCNELLAELEHFELSDAPRGRPNTMNNYGILLNELGFDEDFLNRLREVYLSPITKLLFPEYGGHCLDSHKAFIVKYKTGEDVDLNYHYDNAEVTLNVCLGKQFEEGSLYFGNMRTEQQPDTSFVEYKHKLMHGLIHRGQHMHGAMPITEGERYNLVMWLRSSKIRNCLCPMCNASPQLVETVGLGDGFTQEHINVCNVE